MRSGRLPLFYAVTMLYWFSVYTYVPLLSPYLRTLGASWSMVGMIIGAYGFTQMLLRIPLGVWSDQLGRRKPFILAGLLVATLSSLGFALTSSPAAALVFRGLAGVAAASWVVFTVLYASYHEVADAPKAMGVISFYTSLGQMAASTAGGLLAQRFGWHAAFWLGAAGGVAGCALGLGVEEGRPSDGGGVRPAALLRVGGDRIVLGVSCLAALAQVATFSTMYGFTPEAAVHLGASKADLSWLTLITT
ncbi:MAG: MFS transporter, partial [Chloroflexi bacterium]|nr:MFS transporter [Chloroflexota bacterium]